MFEKLNFKLVAIDIAFVFLFTTGLKRLYVSSQAEFFQLSLDNDIEGLTAKYGSTISDLFFQLYFWPLGYMGIALLIISVINWRFKVPFINLILVFIFSLSFFPLGIINGDYIPSLFNSFCYVFSNELKTSFLIGGILITGASLILLGLNIKNKSIKKSTLN